MVAFLGFPRHLWLLSAAFLAVVVSFIAATYVADLGARSIGELSESLSGNAMASIERLARARAELRHIEALAAQAAMASPAERPDLMRRISASQVLVDESVDAYLRLPVYPGEADIWRDVRAKLHELDDALAHLRTALEASDGPAAAAAVRELHATCDEAVESMLRVIEFNAEHGEALARRIGELRTQSVEVTVALHLASVALTLVVAFLLVRMLAMHTKVLRANNELLRRRAGELEQFAGRVSHDLRTPLSTVSLMLGMIARSDSGLDAGKLAGRALAGLERANGILDSLLAFARAGAHPAAGARADVRAVVAEVVEELAPVAAEAGVRLRVAPVPEGAVACDGHLLTIVLENLLQNALKYAGNGGDSVVSVDVAERARDLRIEVRDTGPGIAPDLRAAIFNPFVRGPNPEVPGVGLGLATVKRICDSHGGRVGVADNHPRGSCFWVELPKADGLRSAVEAAPSRAIA